MKVIAHRPFRDERALAHFDPACLSGFDGVELDLRTTDDGAVTVFHAPILTGARRPSRGAVKPLERVLNHLDAAGAPTELVFLDVKTSRAMQAIDDTLRLLGEHRTVAFICWHLDEVELARRAAPGSKVYLAVAPIRRARPDGPQPEDYYLFNRFPYIASSRRFRQRAEQFNQHNINVRWLDPASVRGGLPDGIDGICFHKLLFNRTICDALRAAGLESAVYGFPSRRDPAIARMSDAIDYAIVDPDQARRRRRIAAFRQARILRRRWKKGRMAS